MRAAVLAASVLSALAPACAREPDDRAPAGAVEEFLEAMRRSEWDARALEDAYGLLSSESRAAIDARAAEASALGGRELAPWQMIPPGRFRLRFVPRPTGAYREEIRGEHATVIVRGVRDHDRAEVALRREAGRWRIELEVPGAREPRLRPE